ncbi:hypothetical protein GCM10008090_33120 [Arenicella chitinivorans]|uniref:CSLREA domain-containing protein n=1 Tax=Arenicella chitinivorans TaxID=1329800 RepID=A0A918S1M5_9GAMM|nr:hypothetical protein GCM10008090_33120 [Arenicella chitinivorans]
MPPLNCINKTALAMAIGHALSTPLQAATIEVTSNADDGTNCTLREAINTVNSGSDQTNGCNIDVTNDALGSNDIIQFAPNVAGQTITLAGSELTVTSSVSINPNGANTGTSTTIDANKASRVMSVTSGTVQLDHLVISGGLVENGGGLYATGTASVSISNSTLSGNSALEGGGLVAIDTASVSISNSTLSGNSAAGGGGLVARNSSSVSISNSTLSGNSAGFDGGGLYAKNTASVSIINSTLSGNSAFLWGGGLDAKNTASVSISNSTLSGNSARFGGGGLQVQHTANVSISNSIIANSASGACFNGGSGTIAIATDSIVDDTSCSGASFANPLLEPLADNGGPTLTHALMSGSPAINRATGAGATSTDQRGFAAVGTRDIGAFEFGVMDPNAKLNLTVTSTADDNGAGCTLREAIATTNARGDLDNGCFNIGSQPDDHIIQFAPNVAGQTITLAGSELTVTGSVSINPNGANTTIDANQASRVMSVTSGTVQLDHLVISGGNALNGGGLNATGTASVSIINSTLSGNSADGGGGGLLPRESASVSISNSTLSGNSARFGGGLTAVGRSSVSIINSTVSGNSADSDGGGLDITALASVSIINSTVSGNSAGFDGGGLSAQSISSVSIINSTLSGNSAGDDGGGLNALFHTRVSIINSTLSGNSASNSPGGGGGGLHARERASFNISNSIIANSTGGACLNRGTGTIAIATDSIVDDSSCRGATVADPLLEPLADNGGPTLTHALMSGSPAINRATGAGATNTDQRGFAAVGTRDVGAFEFGVMDPNAKLNLTVTSTADDNGAGCTLREAIATTNARGDLDNGCFNIGSQPDDHIIQFAPNVAGQTITLAGSELTVTGSVSINPNGASTTIDANQASRVMSVTSGTVQLDHLVISGGSASVGATRGGGLYAGDWSSVSISNSTLSGNSASVGGGLHAQDSASVSISNSTLSGNSARFYGGGLHAQDSASVSISNSTLSGNSAHSRGGGLYAEYSASVSIINSTLSGNSAVFGGGGLVATDTASVSINNSIVANSAGDACDGIGIIAIATDSIVDDTSCRGATVADPLLEPLADNGGPTLTHALLSGSPAINPGSSVNPTSTDQRGFAAVGTRDVGAFEAQQLSVSVSPDVMPENGGASTGTVTRSVLIDRPLEVNLASSDLSSAMVPTSVVIPAGEASATFAISAVDDTLADGNSISTISVNAIGYVVGSATVTVVDNDTPSLGLTLNSSSISESGITVATVSRNTPTNTALNVSLSSNNPTRLVIPATVEIPVGAAFVNFNITGIDNTTLDADQLVTITASGLGSVTANLLVTDDDDDDTDGIADNADNCPSTPNPNQDDFEGDGIGDACDNDIDGDGMSNQYELDNGLNPRNSFDRDADPDGDGFTNLEEFEFSTDPNVPNPDDDNNGIPDDAPVATPQRRFPLPAILPLLLDE